MTGILEGLPPAQANFQIVATNVRPGSREKNYVLQDGAKLKSITEKWRFASKPDPLARCGYDYQIVATNGGLTIAISICFLCNTLLVNHRERYRTTKKQILRLLAEDFRPLN